MKESITYDAMGQRIAKTVTNKNTTDGTDKFVTTYYVRDPQGNVLAVYEKKEDAAGAGQFQLKERHLYGAGRLGMVSQNVTLAQFDNSNVTNGTDPTTPQAGDTHYELTNHLGNVMAVISDKASSTAEPTVVSLSDYYPFGMTEPGRNWNAGDYRFGYTGHEKENDLAEGVYTTEYRLLDTRLGRWMSVDPLWSDYPELSSYVYCAGNPMVMVDPDGRNFNGGFSITNNTNETIILGGCTGMNENGEEETEEGEIVTSNGTFYGRVELQPGQKLVPTIKNDIYYAEIQDENGTVLRTVKAYDVDFILLGEGQTFVVNGQRYNEDVKDKNAKTPKSDFGEGTIKISSSFWRFLHLVDKCGGVVLTQDKSGGDIKMETEAWFNNPIIVVDPIEHDEDKK